MARPNEWDLLDLLSLAEWATSRDNGFTEPRLRAKLKEAIAETIEALKARLQTTQSFPGKEEAKTIIRKLLLVWDLRENVFPTETEAVS